MIGWLCSAQPVRVAQYTKLKIIDACWGVQLALAAIMSGILIPFPAVFSAA